MVEKIQTRIEEIKEIQEVFVNIGGGAGLLGTETASNSASMTINIGSVKNRKRSVDEIADEVRNLTKDIPGAQISVTGSSFMAGLSGSSPISIDISGDDFEQLEVIANDFVEIVRSVDGTREVSHSVEEGTPEAQIVINRSKASMYGFNMTTISNALRTAVQGSVATKYKVNGTEIDVRIQYDSSQLEYLKDIKDISVTSALGVSIPLSEIADISINKSPVSIMRDNQKRMVTVSSSVFGRDINSVKKDIEEKLKNIICQKAIIMNFQEKLSR